MEKLIVKILFGSHLYGTNTPNSDLDYKSIYIPCARDIILQRALGSVSIGAKQKAEGEKNLPGDVDNECYSLQKYLRLIAEGQTVAIDMLFAPEPLITTSLWRYIKENKDKLLTKRSAAFVGYCRTQANKYGIKGSRVAAAKNAYNLFSELVAKHGPNARVGDFFEKQEYSLDDHTHIIQKETTQGNIEWFYQCCNRMVGFTGKIGSAKEVYGRIHDNYGDRAKQAQINEGIDWKALSHAVRVGNEALELLDTHKITFPLPYTKHLLEIKLGQVPYNKVATEIEELLEKVEKASKVSVLNDTPNYKFIDDLVFNEYCEQVMGELE